MLKSLHFLVGLKAASCALTTDSRIDEPMTLITRNQAQAERTASPAADAAMPEPVGQVYEADAGEGLSHTLWPSYATSPAWTSSQEQANINSTATGFASFHTATGSAGILSTSSSDSSSTSVTAVTGLVTTSSSTNSSVTSDDATIEGPKSTPTYSSASPSSTADPSAVPLPSSTSFESSSSANTTTTVTTIVNLGAHTSTFNTDATHDQSRAGLSQTSPTTTTEPTPSLGCLYENIRKIGNGEYVSQDGISCGTSAPSSTVGSSSVTTVPSTAMPGTSSPTASSVDSETTTTPSTTSKLGPVESVLNWLTSTQAGSTATAAATVSEPITSAAGANRLRVLF